MAKRRTDRPATDKLMLALEGVSATLAIMKDAQQADIPRLIDKAKGYTEEAQDALTTIQFHLGLLR